MATKITKTVSILFLIMFVGTCVVGAVSAHDEEPVPVPTDNTEPTEAEPNFRISYEPDTLPMRNDGLI